MGNRQRAVDERVWDVPAELAVLATYATCQKGSDGSTEAKADELRREHLGSSLGFPVDIEALARSLGLRILEIDDLPRGAFGAMYCEFGHEGRAIAVDRFASSERRREEVAHEIAHFLEHQNRTFVSTTVLKMDPASKLPRATVEIWSTESQRMFRNTFEEAFGKELTHWLAEKRRCSLVIVAAREHVEGSSKPVTAMERLQRNDGSTFLAYIAARIVDEAPGAPRLVVQVYDLDLEMEADRLARTLLIPRDDFAHCIRSYGLAIDWLAQRYGVSRGTVALRAADLSELSPLFGSS